MVPVVQTLRYFAAPHTLLGSISTIQFCQAQQAGAFIVMACGVGDTLVFEYRVAAGSWCENCTARKRPLTCLQTIT